MDVALVGVMAPGVENHSLAVLGQELAAAGYEHAVVPFGGFAAMERMLGEVGRLRPRICGVSLQSTESALAALTFSRLLRARGYQGRIVFGGHVATLSADDILAAPAGVDVVVQLAGESALVGLARGEDALSLPGTVTRGGRGRPPLAVRPRTMPRGPLAEHLGFGTADLLASRGCEAHCGYCCVAAVSDLAQRFGEPRHAAQEIDTIADEIAALAERGARAFHFMDDNLLPLEPAGATDWARMLRAALDDRRLPPLAFSLQLRADAVTPALADELARLGLVRAYVGIDGYSPSQLHAIGRTAAAAAGNNALAALSERGVLCVANALLVGPTIPFESIVAEVAALAAVRRAPVHLLPIEARAGTVHHRRASARGLIEGGMLWPVYRFADERSFLVGEVVTGLPSRLAERSVPIALYDLAWTLGVARRLAPEAEVGTAAATYAAATTAWNADQVRILSAAIEAACDGPAAVSALLARERPVVRAHDDALLAACDHALVQVERAVSALRRRRVHAQTRGRVLGRLAMAMGLASACGGGPTGGFDATAAADAPAAADARADARAAAVDAPASTAVDAAGAGGPDAAAACVDPGRTLEPYVQPNLGCECASLTVDMTFDADGQVDAIVGTGGVPLPADIQACLLDLFAMYCYPSLAGTTVTYMTCHAWIA